MPNENEIGEHLGTVKWKFGRAEGRNHSINANSQVSVNTVEGVERGCEYVAKMKANGRGELPFDGTITFVADIYDTDSRFTVPVDIMRDCNLKPGHCVTVFIYEYIPSEEQASLDNPEPNGGKSETERLREKVEEMQEILNNMQDND